MFNRVLLQSLSAPKKASMAGFAGLKILLLLLSCCDFTFSISNLLLAEFFNCGLAAGQLTRNSPLLTMLPPCSWWSDFQKGQACGPLQDNHQHTTEPTHLRDHRYLSFPSPALPYLQTPRDNCIKSWLSIEKSCHLSLFTISAWTLLMLGVCCSFDGGDVPFEDLWWQQATVIAQEEKSGYARPSQGVLQQSR